MPNMFLRTACSLQQEPLMQVAGVTIVYYLVALTGFAIGGFFTRSTRANSSSSLELPAYSEELYLARFAKRRNTQVQRLAHAVQIA